MHRLACRSSLGHCSSRLLPSTIRSNSTQAADSPDIPPAPSKPRIASSWGDIVIPSRREITQKQPSRSLGVDDAKVYQPNLQYLRGSSPTGVAGRLTQKIEKSAELVREAPVADVQPVQPLGDADPHLEVLPLPAQTKPPRAPDETIAKRRAERLAREAARLNSQAALRQEESSYNSPRIWRKASQFEGADKAVEALVLSNFRQPSYGIQSTQRREQTRGGIVNRNAGTRHGSQLQNRRSGAMSAARGRGGGIAVRPRKPKEGDGLNSRPDISMEILETGGDDKEPPEFINPEPLMDLDDLFGRSPATTLGIITAAEQNAPRTPDRTQWLKENFGGDYNRFSPISQEIYRTPVNKLDPLDHVKATLSGGKDFTVAARHRTLKIVETSMMR